jgi:hypothetical protein
MIFGHNKRKMITHLPLLNIVYALAAAIGEILMSVVF